jgi:hypothetical protein
VCAPVAAPEDIVERVHRLCLALPEVTVRVGRGRIGVRRDLVIESCRVLAPKKLIVLLD